MPRKGEAKHSPEERAAICDAYRSGSNLIDLAERYGLSVSGVRKLLSAAGVTRRPPGCVAGPHPNHQKPSAPLPAATAEQTALVTRWYSEGAGMEAIARRLGWTRRAADVVRSTLERAGIPIRSAADANREHWDVPLHEMTTARWHELYWTREHGYPSLAQLAERLGVSRVTVRRHLLRHGLAVRTLQQQNALTGRKRTAPKIPRVRTGPDIRTVPCGWCGKPLQRRAVDTRRRKSNACNRQCSGAITQHRLHHAEEPRPLIITRLQELIGSRPLTLENAERFAAECGATEDEVWHLLEL